MAKIADFIISAIVIECNNQTLTVKGMPFWFTFYPNIYVIAGTDIFIIDYIGTDDISIIYLNKPIIIDKGKHINITFYKQ